MDTTFQDSVQPLEAKAVGLNGLGDFTSKDFAILNRFNENMSKNLGDTLPAMTLYSNDGAGNQAETKKETRKAPPGEKIESKDLESGKVNATRKVENGKNSTSAEYPNGVLVTVKELDVVTVKGKFHIPTKVTMEIPPDLKKLGNSYYDATGKIEIIKRNADGTVTINSGDDFYRQGPDGIEKVHAIRQRDGSFREINVKDPLGDLKMSDPAAKKK